VIRNALLGRGEEEKEERRDKVSYRISKQNSGFLELYPVPI
jgi:hypothetical protein